jgi:large conductance mechanosensitive channel
VGSGQAAHGSGAQAEGRAGACAGLSGFNLTFNAGLTSPRLTSTIESVAFISFYSAGCIITPQGASIMGLIKEFKEFAVKGNMLDLAVGLIIGVAFGSVVNSLVNDIIMPPIGMALGHVDFKDLKVVLKEGVVDQVTKVVTTPEVAIRWGLFINTLINFLVVAFCVFLVVKAFNSAKARAERLGGTK